MDHWLITAAATLAGLSAAGLSWYAASVGQQITYVTLADGRRQERTVPLLFRMLLPLCHNVIPLVRHRAFTRTRELSARQLVAGGFEGLLTAEELLSLKILLPVFVAMFWIPFVGIACSHSGAYLRNMAPLLFVMGPLWAYVYPSFWLRHALKTRHNSIQKALPFVLDLLTLSVEAGLDFMTALQRNTERRQLDPLGEELLRVIREIQIGKTRREALRDMGRRVDLPDLRSVVGALVQADELGVSIGAILRIQSDQMRQRRFDRAERLANEAPTKMLMPLMICIFPSVFLILMGPIVLRIARQGF
jgi:pilus assembly protein TadC